MCLSQQSLSRVVLLRLNGRHKNSSRRNRAELALRVRGALQSYVFRATNGLVGHAKGALGARIRDG